MKKYKNPYIKIEFSECDVLNVSLESLLDNIGSLIDWEENEDN